MFPNQIQFSTSAELSLMFNTSKYMRQKVLFTVRSTWFYGLSDNETAPIQNNSTTPVEQQKMRLWSTSSQPCYLPTKIHSYAPMSSNLWMKISSKDWWETVVPLEFTDVEWKCMKLCILIESFMSPEDVTIWPPIPLLMHVEIVYTLRGCAEYCLITNQFGIHKCTVKICV